MRAELGLGSDDVVIGTVANLRAQKDYPTLLTAARLLADRGVAFRLVAVGQGPLEREITTLRDELGLGNHVLLAGFRPDAVAVMAACDVFVLASAWEGLPVAVMEAAALGLPIVATKVGGVAENLGAADAVLVPPRDPVALAAALEPLVTDGRRRAELSAAARSAAARFDVRRAMATLTARYEQLADAPASTTRPRSRPPRPADARAAAGDLRRPRADPVAPRRVARLERRASIPRAVRVEARAQPVRALSSVGRRVRRLHRRRPPVHALGVPAGRSTLRAVRAVDTATHPDHQGRGLFTALTLHALEACRAEGVAFVFNTPNDVSRPGYLKMGWREVGRPAAAARSNRAAATSFPSPGAACRPSVGRFRSTSARTSRHGSTDDGRWPDPPPSCRRRTGRCGPPRTSGSPAGATASRTFTTASSTTGRRRSSCACDAVEPEGLVVADQLGDQDHADGLVVDTLREVGATYALRLGGANLRRGFVPLPGSGPILTWRAVCDNGPPPLPNWDLRLGDVELF